MEMHTLAAGVSTSGFQSFPWWGWVLIVLIIGMLAHGRLGGH
jgi:hypothetical protein